ncbi:hypothetical protein D3C86_1454690 [compost metagenome]
MPRRQLPDNASDMGKTGEIDPTYQGVGNQALDNRRRIARRIADHIDHAVTQPCIVQRLCDQPMGRRTQLRALEHDGIATSQRHGNGAGSENDRSIPGSDAEHDATGLTQGHGKTAGHIRRDHFAIDPGRCRCGLTQDTCRQLHVETIPVGGRSGFTGHGHEFWCTRR